MKNRTFHVFARHDVRKYGSGPEGLNAPYIPSQLDSRIVWAGHNGETGVDGAPVGVFMSTWPHPQPDREVESLEIEPISGNHMDYLLFGITVE